MKKRGLCVLAMVAAVACQGNPRDRADVKPAITPSVAYLAAPSVAPKDRYHPQMAQGGGGIESCDFVAPMPPASSFIDDVKSPASALLAEVVSIGAPRWNTSDGLRPTQADADRMVESLDIEPQIYTPVTFMISRVLKGRSIKGNVAAIAPAGHLGKWKNYSCPFGSFDGLRILDGPESVTLGGTYVVILAGVTVSGRRVLPRATTIVQGIFAVHGNQVVDYAGRAETLPNYPTSA